MKKEKLLSAIGKIDDDLIYNAVNDTKGKEKNPWLKWGMIAACLCLFIAGTTVWFYRPEPSGNGQELEGGDSGGGIVEGGVKPGGDGVWPEGVDPVVASVAVLPAGEELLDVADAILVSITEEDARNLEPLGAYLPNTLPEDCWYGHAGYYETRMKDGTRYHMLRVTYENGTAPAPPAPIEENGQAEQSAIMAGSRGTAFLWMVWGHRPDTDLPVYQPDDITAQLLDQIGYGVFYINYDGVYVGISRMESSAEELMEVILSIE